MAYQRVAFVDASSPTANLRLDLNSDFGDASCRVEHDGFDLGVPSLEGEADALGVTYGLRQVVIPLQIRGPKAAAINMLSAISREVMRPTNWLLFQFDALTPPVWLATYHGTPQPLGLDFVRNEQGVDVWRTGLSLAADAFALGERVTLPPMTFAQSPTGLSHTLPPIRGDAPTPLRAQLAPTAACGAGPSWLLCSAAGPNGPQSTLVNIGASDGFNDSGSSGSGSTVVSNANYFGGSYRAFSPTPSTNPTLSGELPSLPLAKYKVLARAEMDIPAGVAPTFRFSVTIGNSVAVTQRLAPPPTSSGGADLVRCWVDLGDFDIPTGTAGLPADVDFPTGGQNIIMGFGVDQAVGSNSLRIDALLFLPIVGTDLSANCLSINFGPEYGSNALNAGHVGTVDGESERYWGIYQGGTLLMGDPPMTGGFPFADPAAKTNILTVMATNGGSGVAAGPGTIMSLNSTIGATVSYQPKYLHLPGDPDA